MNFDFNIITLHRAHNYGALLQAYALKEFLSQCGYKSGVYDSKQIEAPKVKTLKATAYRMLSALPSIHKSEYNSKKRKFDDFINNNLNINNEVDSKVFIAGSDQIWNPIVFNPDFYLQFASEKSIKASYAASIGVNNIPLETYSEYENLLSSFDAISVRENNAKNELKKIIKDSDIRVDIDPTLLLKKDCWIKKSQESNLKIKGDYVLLYILHVPKNIKSLCKWAKQEYNAKLLLLDQTGRLSHYLPNDEVVRDVGPCDFLALFKNSKAVITTSFHGTAFSVIFEKEFFSVVNPSSPSRISNLLSMLDIPVINDTDEYFSRPKLLYESINQIIDIKRKDSQQYFDYLYSEYEIKNEKN